VKVYRTRVTPKQAAEWLKTNTRNRPVTQKRVELYASQMKAGEWALTADCIRFTDKGVLIDGQHRLTACVMANTPFETYVAEGLEPSSFNKLDQCYPRTVAHAFGREKKKHYNLLAAAVRMVWLLETSQRIAGGQKLSIDEAFEVLQRHPALERCCDVAQECHGPTCPLPGSYLAGFMTWCYELHGDKGLQFWQRVGGGIDLQKGSPEALLYKKLMADKGASTRIHRDVVMAYCIKAYNAYIKGKPIAKLTFDIGKEEMPEFAKS